MFVISIKITDLIYETTATAAKNVWTKFALKISKLHLLSQHRNSYIFCLLKKGTGPEGSICIIAIAFCCHKQRYSRTGVNGMKILQPVFLISCLFFRIFDVHHLFMERKVRRGKVQIASTCYCKLKQKGKRPLLLFR